jgi:hypothetical protein
MHRQMTGEKQNKTETKRSWGKLAKYANEFSK